MNRILVLGAGLVSKPGVTYLLEHGLPVTVASRTVSKAEDLVKGYANGMALELNVKDEQRLEELIGEHDIIVSLLPWIHHVKVANLCVKHSKHMATTSYVSEGMQQLDAEVRRRDLLFLNEIGVDPGIDHMSAMKIIHAVHDEGGRIEHFFSYCGGLPAPEDNDNPFGYKFSWSPRGVVLASRNSARYLKDGQVVEIPGRDLFLDIEHEEIDGVGRMEVYPNRDSLPYVELYGLEEAQTVKRGTYRFPGWCDTFKKLVDLGMIDETPVPGLEGKTYRQMMAGVAGVAPTDDVKAAVARQAGLAPDAPVIQRLEWLGLFSDEPVTADNYLDVLSNRLQEKLYYAEGERDMIVLRHTFIVANPDGSRDRITSTLIDFGIPHGATSMARTVSLPLAVGVKLMAEGKIGLRGVQRPMDPAVYEPVMAELARLGIEMVEERKPL
ncbi:MAG: saccharopine dehydrogenase NADP-binding domain-containing protein [Acidobacteria bacterium]|nr:saccharopine dehydrogenase NADP-binding domain-containing protein [Acidobacteriota bacterium]